MQSDDFHWFRTSRLFRGKAQATELVSDRADHSLFKVGSQKHFRRKLFIANTGNISFGSERIVPRSVGIAIIIIGVVGVVENAEIQNFSEYYFLRCCVRNLRLKLRADPRHVTCAYRSVWPDYRIKSSPISSKVTKNIGTIFLLWKWRFSKWPNSFPNIWFTFVIKFVVKNF